MADALLEGRAAFAAMAWDDAHRLLLVLGVDRLGAEDLERLAVASCLRGDDSTSDLAWEQAHARHAAAGHPGDAGRCAFWNGLTHLLRGQTGPAGGWLARAARWADEADDAPVRGLILVPSFLEALWSGRPDEARSLAENVLQIGRHSGDSDVMGFGLLCCGEALVGVGRMDDGLRSIDEAMVAVTTGELSPIAAGIVYCAVIETCIDCHDVRRAREWTEAFDRWTASQTGLVPFQGQCLLHRSQVLQAQGDWDDAVREADRAVERLATTAHPAVGNALYQLAELHRLRGETAEAESAYRKASLHGREPEPGLALLRLAEGDVAAAIAAIDVALETTRGSRAHLTTLAASVEVYLAAGRVDDARSLAAELVAAIPRDGPASLIAVADFAAGSVALAGADPAVACTRLRSASETWLAHGVRYQAARCRERLAAARRQLGDDEGADLDLDAAQATFDELGATFDAARVRAVAAPKAAAHDGLSDREIEVLRVVATGATNRGAADVLAISEHTVARHLQNIYVKLGISTRTAAATYAHQHHLTSEAHGQSGPSKPPSRMVDRGDAGAEHPGVRSTQRPHRRPEGGT